MSLLWPITKENRKGLHKRKPILTCPSETCPWERQHGAENPGREVSCTLSQDPESMAGRFRAWNPICWAHFDLARHSCLSIFHILSSTANEKLHFSFRAKGRDEKRRLQDGQEELSESRLPVIWWQRVDGLKELSFGTAIIRGRRRECSFLETWAAAPKVTGNSECSVREHRPTPALPPESNNIQIMARAVTEILTSLSKARKRRPGAAYVPGMGSEPSSLMAFPANFI